MNVLITGAHGFLGRYTARHLANKGYTVQGIGHGQWTQAEWREWGLTNWTNSELTYQSLQACAGQPHAIVHCVGGGSVGYAESEPYLDFQKTVQSTIEVLEFIRRDSPETRFLYPSSASVYGKALTFPIAETSPVAPISAYGMHKRMAEELVLSYARRFAVPAAIVRFFSLYGPGLRKQLLWDACRKLAEGNTLFAGTGEEVRDWLYIADAAELIGLAIEHADLTCPIINGGSGAGLTVREVLQYLSQTFSPGLAPRFSGGKRPGDPDCYIADTTKAQQWGWTSRKKCADGMAEYVSWWKQEMLLASGTKR